MDGDPPDPKPANLDELFSPISLQDPYQKPSSPLPDPDPDPITPPPDLTRRSSSPFASPLSSPRNPRSQPLMPEFPPELTNVLDSSINGDFSSLQTLISIITNEVSRSRSVVDALLAIMGGIDGFDESNKVKTEDPPSVMINPQAAVVAAKLIPLLPLEGDFKGLESPRTRMVRGLLAILNGCNRNRALCYNAGLLSALFEAVENVFEVSSLDGFQLCECIEILAGHSLSVSDLSGLLGLVKKTLGTEWALGLMLALENAMGSEEVKGPKTTFELDGESSGLLGPGESRWPFYSGYAFATWIYIESFADTLNTATAAAAIAAAAAAKCGKSSAMSAAAAASALAGEGTTHMPRLFSFISSDNHGIEAYFHGQFLVVETGGGGGKGKKASLHFTHSFKPQCWYFIGLEHTCRPGLMGKSESELRLYVDGRLYESRPFEFPRVTKSLAFCCIGTNPPPTMAGLQRRRRQCPLFAEMGPVYIFKESIGPERMARLAFRGGDALPIFGNGSGSPWRGTNEEVGSLAEESAKLNAEIGGSLHLLYHPALLSGRFCPDASPSGTAGTHRRPAEVLGQVHVATRLRPAESLWALAYGGPMVLLPLTVSNVQMDNFEPVFGDSSSSLSTASLAASVFRIISMAIQLPGNNEELYRSEAPEILSKVLHYLLQKVSGRECRKDGTDEELFSSVIYLCQSQKNHALKVQLFSSLLLDLKIWSFCNNGLQKKLLSSLADMVFTESAAMRDANALHVLLDGCRRCYWVVHEADSVDTFLSHENVRPIGELNALVDELMVVIELLIGRASSSSAAQDIRSLIGFLVDCQQPNQVARVLHLLYRLVVQPNTSRALAFAQSFITSGGIEALLFLLQQEAKTGDRTVSESSSSNNVENVLNEDARWEGVIQESRVLDDQVESSEFEEAGSSKQEPKFDSLSTEHAKNKGSQVETANSEDGGIHGEFELPEQKEPVLHNENPESELLHSNKLTNISVETNIEKMTSISENELLKSLGCISFSINADSARNNVRNNIDNGDGIVVGIIKLLGALVTSGHLKLTMPSKVVNSGLSEDDNSMLGDKVLLLLFALQKAFEAAPCRLMTSTTYMALLGATINFSSTDDGLSLYDTGHRFEHVQLLLVLLRSLPYAARTFQLRALQDLLFLACSHPENRSTLTLMEEWPEWLLEVLITNHEIESNKISCNTSIAEIEDLIHNFLIIMLEHSMRQKDGWKDVEATIHCAEWLSMIGGSSTGEQRMRREESLPLFKRRLLGGLLDFASRELQVQTQVIAAAAAGVAAEGLSPQEAKAEAENAAQLSVALAENAIVILMLVEDHLRSRGQLFCSIRSTDGHAPVSSTSSGTSRYSSVGKVGGNSLDGIGSKRTSASTDPGGLPLDVLASMADASGQISAAVMERLTAAAAAEPYESVRCAFVSYGSYIVDLSEGWKQRSRMWYGVGLLPKTASFGGGGSGWDAWNSNLEKDSNGDWVELPLVKKSVTMLQALLSEECGLGGGLGVVGGSGTGMGGMTALYQLLDSDQPFLCMLRMVLASMREDDNGEDNILMRNISIKDGISEGLSRRSWKMVPTDNNTLSARKPHSGLLWSVLAPILNLPISESKRQRVLVASCILFAEVWHSIGKDMIPLRKQYLEAILPPYIAILRRWRPLLAGIHELTSPDGLNPLIVDDRALAADSLPLEAALSMISPGWAAAFASPPAAMALAMMAAGAAGGETVIPLKRRESSMLERKTTRSHTFANFQRLPDVPNKSPPILKDKASAKAVALAAARDLERNAKIGSGRGLSAVAMATSAQRRSARDTERANRWNIFEAMGTAWAECLQSVDPKLVYGKDSVSQSNSFIALLIACFALSRDIQEAEMKRRLEVHALDRHHQSSGTRSWRKLIRRLMETGGLFGPFGDHIFSPEHVFWKLDFVESSSRMRRFLVRNFKGSDHLGAAANYEDQIVHSNSIEHSDMRNVDDPEASLTANLPSTASIMMADAMSMEEGTENEEQPETDNLENVADNQQASSATSSVTGQSKGLVDSRISGVPVDQNLLSIPVHSPGHMPSETDEKIIIELSSLMVRPLKIVRGTFQVTTKRIKFIVDEQIDVSFIEDTATATRQNIEKDKDRSWLLSSLHQIYSRRYLLRRSALELFLVDRSNFFFDFESIEMRKKAYRAVVQARPPHLNNVYLATQRPEQLLKRTQLMERWARWEISNFEYLMALNTMAGRSYNDITQYPVFPWILADYSSTTLDLADPSSYRDLSKPVGALKPERLKKFQERYSSFDDPIIPKFHYGSHYSSAGTVLYYLVRLEPFTTLSIQLQGGKFDHADRLFSDIGGTWNGVLEDMSDVKELVPEMFYLPEVLTNVNSIDFGTTQLGEKLDSVKLPAWADSPVDFIHKHRKALESEHASAHLHEWIDLIFGYKQRGRDAVSANNVFFYITYEGTVDIDKITDPVQQRATQDQIAYFGQTPSQLLVVPHIKKRSLADVLHLQTIFRNPDEIKPYVLPNPERCNIPAAAIYASQDSVVIVDINAPAAHVAIHRWQPNTPDNHGTPFLFEHGKTAGSSTGGTFMRMFKGPAGPSFEDWQFPRAFTFAASGIRSSAVVAVTCDREIITGGHADNSVKLISSDGAKTIETAFGHCAAVTCLSLSADSVYLITGSRDTTVLLWKIHRPSPSNPNNILNTSPTSRATPTSPMARNNSSNSNARIEGPVHILRGHLGEVISCSVSSDLGIAASSSSNSGVLLHSLRRGRLLRRLDIGEADAICLSSQGVVMTWKESERRISTFTVNGLPIATTTLSPLLGTVSCIEISLDGENAVIGTSSSFSIDMTKDDSLPIDETKENGNPIPVPAVCFLNLHTLQVFHTLVLRKGQDITALALNKDNTNLLVSTSDKQLIIFTDPTLSVKVVDQMLRLGWEGGGLTINKVLNS